MDTSYDNDHHEPNYFEDVAAREEELRKINQELDTKLNIVSKKDGIEVPSVNDLSLDVSPRYKYKTDDTIKCAKSCIKPKVRKLSPASSVNTIASSSQSCDSFRMAILDVSEEDDYDDNTDDNYDCDSVKFKTVKRLSDNKGNNAKSRVQQARIKTLTSKLRETILSNKETDKIAKSFEAKSKQLDEDKKRLERELFRLKSAAGRKLDDSKSMNDEVDGLRIENQSLQKEVAGLKGILKESESKSRTREVRLNRAMESVDKFKKLATEGRSEKNESKSKTRKEIEDLLKQTTDLKKQKSDLLLALKKQIKLIDVLKRQKVHVEASRMLDFTEREFIKVLDWGCKSKDIGDRLM